jgi:Heterokaryon incompatibility protein (HET)
MNQLEHVDDMASQGDLENLRLDDTTKRINHAPSVDPNANRTSLDGQSDALAIKSPGRGDSCLPPATKEDLCEACQKIDFDALTEAKPGRYPFLRRDALWSLGPQPYRSLEESAKSCRLCRFFAEFFRESMGEPISKDELDPIMVSLSNEGKGDLWSLSWEFNDLAFGMGGYSRPYFCLCVRYQNPDTNEGPEDRIQFCRRPGWDRPPLGFRVPTPQVPFDLIRSWLEFCQCHHGSDCSKGGATSIQPLRVIDCEPTARRVVQYSLEFGKYAALSYVWGAPLETVDTPPLFGPGGLPSVLLRTIEEAITVTLNLGLRYLWVDQYCVSQDHEGKKARQIRLMCEIYHGAELTIIASAATDANYGLPGVGSIPREVPRSIQIGVDTLVDMPEHDFSLSRGGTAWCWRGWTYQEGVLSRRRLVFTENQVYFRCAEMSIWEALDIPLDLLHYEAQRGGQRRESKMFNFGQHFQSTKENMTTDHHIGSYFSTELSRPEDAIHAISGIFSYFNKVKETMLMLSGLPLSVTHDSHLGPPTYPLTHAVLLALGWHLWASQLER